MTAIEAPERSLDQRMDALKKANVVRTARKELKRDLKRGRRLAVNVITDPPEHCDGMKVFDVLMAAPKIGRVKAGSLLSICRVSPSKTLGGLSQRQRTELALLLRARLGPVR